jgi:hypothetical protein
MRHGALNVVLRKTDNYECNDGMYNIQRVILYSDGCGNLQMNVMKTAAQSEYILKLYFCLIY